MRFKTGLILGAAIGYAIAARRFRAEPDEETTSRLVSMAAHPAARKFTEQGRRMAERASLKSVDAIQRARESIQRRIEAEPDDFSMN